MTSTPRSASPASATPRARVKRGPVPGVARPPATGLETDVEPRRRPRPRKWSTQQAVKRQPGTTTLARPGLPRRKARLPDGSEHAHNCSSEGNGRGSRRRRLGCLTPSSPSWPRDLAPRTCGWRGWDPATGHEAGDCGRERVPGGPACRAPGLSHGHGKGPGFRTTVTLTAPGSLPGGSVAERSGTLGARWACAAAAAS